MSPLNVLRKALVLITGGGILLAGVVMLVTPGPGIIAILAGLGILSSEFAFARRLLLRIRRKVSRANDPYNEENREEAS